MLILCIKQFVNYPENIFKALHKGNFSTVRKIGTVV